MPDRKKNGQIELSPSEYNELVYGSTDETERDTRKLEALFSDDGYYEQALDESLRLPFGAPSEDLLNAVASADYRVERKNRKRLSDFLGTSGDGAVPGSSVRGIDVKRFRAQDRLDRESANTSRANIVADAIEKLSGVETDPYRSGGKHGVLDKPKRTIEDEEAARTARRMEMRPSEQLFDLFASSPYGQEQAETLRRAQEAKDRLQTKEALLTSIITDARPARDTALKELNEAEKRARDSLLGAYMEGLRIEDRMRRVGEGQDPDRAEHRANWQDAFLDPDLADISKL